MTITEPVKSCPYLFNEAFDSTFWMSTSIPCKASCLNEHPIPTFERTWLVECLLVIQRSGIFPTFIHGILIWARGFSMEGIESMSPGGAKNDWTYILCWMSLVCPTVCFPAWWLYQPSNVWMVGLLDVFSMLWNMTDCAVSWTCLRNNIS